MIRHAATIRRWVIGETWRQTGVAVLFAGMSIIVTSAVEYRVLSREITGGEPPALLFVRETFRLAFFWERGTDPSTAVLGYLLVIAIAGLYAYYNLGYLTGLLLASSPSAGIALWSIHGFDEYVTMTPTLVFDRVLPEAPLVASLGFFLGVGLRIIVQPTLTSQQKVPDRTER